MRSTRDKRFPLGYDRLAFDSAIEPRKDAAAIFRRALDVLNVDCEGIEDIGALRKLFERSIKPPQKLSDSDLLELAELVPGSLDQRESMAHDARNSEGKMMITSAIARRIRAGLREDAEARQAVRSALGSDSRALAQDSPGEIYSFALDQLGIDHREVEDVPALRALFNLALEKRRNPGRRRVAFDANDARSISEKFPSAMREIRIL